jgi:hypothetical protein
MYDFDEINGILAELAEMEAVEPMVEPVDDPAVLCDFYDWAEIVGVDVDEWIPEEYTF